MPFSTHRFYALPKESRYTFAFTQNLDDNKHCFFTTSMAKIYMKIVPFSMEKSIFKKMHIFVKTVKMTSY